MTVGFVVFLIEILADVGIEVFQVLSTPKPRRSRRVAIRIRPGQELARK